MAISLSQIAEAVEATITYPMTGAGFADSVNQLINSISDNVDFSTLSNGGQMLAGGISMMVALRILNPGYAITSAVAAAAITTFKNIHEISQNKGFGNINIGDVITLVGNIVTAAATGAPSGSLTTAMNIGGSVLTAGGLMQSYDPAGLQKLVSGLVDGLKNLFEFAQTASPLILDLDGNGIETIGTLAGVHFDHDGNGFAETTGWVGKNDGLLVWDRNGNGKIDNGTELFGNQTLLANNTKAANGFAALAELDSNGDGKVDANDTVFSQLRVWKDSDSNGQAGTGELLTLGDAGVQSLNTAFTNQTQTDVQSNKHLQVGQYTRTDGTVRVLTDVWFKTDMAHTMENDIVSVDSTIAALPDLEGFGNVHSLHQAMARDTSGRLQSLVQDFASEQDATARKAIVTTLLYAWTGVENVAPNSRTSSTDGNTMGDARKLAALEAFLGEGFVGTAAADPANPRQLAAPNLLDAFDMLSQQVYSKLMAQTYFKGLYDKVDYLAWDTQTASFELDVSEVISDLENAYTTDPAEGLQWMKEFGQNLVANGDLALEILNALRQEGNSSGQGFDLYLSQLGWNSLTGDATNNILQGAEYENYSLVGLDGSDQLNGNTLDDFLDGGSGNDSLDGGGGNDTYVFSLGYGVDTINDRVGLDTLKIVGVSPSQVTLLRIPVNGDVNGELVVKINGTVDEVHIQHQFDGSSPAIERIVFDDGTFWGAATINAAPITPTQAGTIQGTYGDDVFDLSNPVSNTLCGAYVGAANYGYDTGNDTYIFGVGAGQDDISDYGNSFSNLDIIKIAGLTPSQVTLTREIDSGYVTNNLLVKINGTNDQVRVLGQFTSSSYAIEQIKFDDGTIWDSSIIDRAPIIPSTPGSVQGTYGSDLFDLRSSVNNTAYGAYSLAAAYGNDTGNDTYLFGTGSGQDTISDYGTAAGNIDTIRITGLTPSQVTLAREIENGIAGNNLLVKVNGTNDQLRIQDQFYSSSYAVEKILFDDGTIWDAAVMNTAPITPTAAGSVRGSYDADIFDLRNAVSNTVSGAYSGYDSGNDTYIFGTGSGQDTIIDYGTAAGNIDTIRITGLTPSQVTLAREIENGIAGNNLLVKVNGTNDQLRIQDQFYSSSYAVEKILFDDGTIWDAAVMNTAPITPTAAGSVRGSYDADIFDLRNAVNNTVSGAYSGYDSGNDTYLFGTDSGQDTIIDYGTAAGNIDTIRITGLTPSQVTLSHEVENGMTTNNLLVTIVGTYDKLRVQDHFYSSAYAIEQIVFDDGTVWGNI